tara:strand:- start:4574 stop:5002 length:429 start_codon:yes stop_codon:yes gene_type:complete
MKISFEGEVADVVTEVIAFLTYIAAEAVVTDQPIPDIEPEEKPKRRDRPRKEEPVAETSSQDPEAEPVEEEKPTRRRGRPKTNGAAAPDISDADVAKAASQAASRITPKAVTAVLEEFGVGTVNDLDQAQRQEFMDRLDAAS